MLSADGYFSKLRLTKAVILVICLYFFCSQPAYSESKLRVCRPDLCQPRSSIPKAFKPMISNNEGLITKNPKVLSKNFTFSTEVNGTPAPQISVPADRRITSICHVNSQSRLLCHEEVSYSGCPKFISFTVEDGSGSLAIVECDLTCSPPTPDASTGTCECDPINCQYA